MLSDDYVKKILNGTYTIGKYISYKEFSSSQLKKLQEFFSEWKYLSTAETAVWLGVSTRTIYRMIKNGRIFAIRLSKPYGPYRIDVKKTKELLNI